MGVKLLHADLFLPIVKKEDNSGHTVFYGADQAWFQTRVGRYSGCGATAAADIFAYLALRSPQLKNLYADSAEELTLERFLRHMDAVIQYVPPGHIPKIDVPYAGLTSLPRFTRYCDAYLASRSVPLKGHYHSNRQISAEQAAGLIEEQLSQDNPVALLIMQNRKLKSVSYTDVHGKPGVTDLRFHWVVITAIESTDKGRFITASSEGAKVTFDFADAWNCDAGSVFGWRGIVYFE
jgi:hypothetical protein